MIADAEVARGDITMASDFIGHLVLNVWWPYVCCVRTVSQTSRLQMDVP